MKYAIIIFFALFGVLSLILFRVGIYFPIWLSVLVLLFVTAYLFKQYRRKQIGILMLLIWGIYVLPFIHIPAYIWFDFTQKPLLLWGLVVNPYMLDELVVALTAMIGAVGAVGIALGAAMNAKRVQQDSGLEQDGNKRLFRTISFPIWLLWIFVGLVLSVLSAPQDSVFTAAYTQSSSALEGANFSSSWMMSYVVLSFAFCDALLERHARIRYFKISIVSAVIILIVVVLQLLRGDRESVPWVFGLALLYYYWAAGITQRHSFAMPWIRIAIVAVGLLVVSMIVGAARSGLTGASLSDAKNLVLYLYESGSIGLGNILNGTWSAILLTPLSVAGDHIYGLLPIKWGRDYVDLFLSIIPGFMADAIGYVRPIDAGQGPAYQMRYGLGGTHATVVPFLNFRMLGVFLVPAVWTFLMITYEKFALRQVSVTKLSLLVTIAMASPHWLWYGEKSGLNALIMWMVLSFFYRVSLGLSMPAYLRRSSIKSNRVASVKS